MKITFGEDCIDDPTLGLTKRELFAVMALEGLLSEWPRTSDYETIARDAVRFADALIKELNK